MRAQTFACRCLVLLQTQDAGQNAAGTRGEFVGSVGAGFDPRALLGFLEEIVAFLEIAPKRYEDWLIGMASG